MVFWHGFLVDACKFFEGGVVVPALSFPFFVFYRPTCFVRAWDSAIFFKSRKTGIRRATAVDTSRTKGSSSDTKQPKLVLDLLTQKMWGKACPSRERDIIISRHEWRTLADPVSTPIEMFLSPVCVCVHALEHAGVAKNACLRRFWVSRKSPSAEQGTPTLTPSMPAAPPPPGNRQVHSSVPPRWRGTRTWS